MARLIPKKCKKEDCAQVHCNKSGYCSDHPPLAQTEKPATKRRTKKKETT